jgi:hypothetical protein
MNESTSLEQPADKRGPGRPPKEQSLDAAPVKKGKPTWKPANVIKVNPREGYTPRMINKDPDNLMRKQNEGWEIESGLNSKAPTEQGYGRIEHGKPMTTVPEGHDYVIGWIPNEMAEARRGYYQAKTDRLEQALARDAAKDMAKATGGKGQVHGSIQIEKRGVKTILD